MPMPDPVTDIAALNAGAAGLGLLERLHLIAERTAGKRVFTTSFGLEDQYLTHYLARSGLDAVIATLDTGRLFAETHDTWSQTESRYGIRIMPFCPRADALEDLVGTQGVNGFRGSLAARKACCAVRKVEPLSRALAGASVWITGLRAGQSATRAATPFAEADPARGLIKINPLFDMDAETVRGQVYALDIPYNPLHDQGFPSIGCQPCTRAVRVGEDERAGRWWWEQSGKECGLHADTAQADTERAA